MEERPAYGRTITVNGKQLGIEDIYLDLSKLSEEEEKSIKELICYYPSGGNFNILLNYMGEWDAITKYNALSIETLTEITYSQFLELIGEPKQEKIREKEIFEEDGSLYIGEGLENYYIDQLTRTNKYAVFPLDENGIVNLIGLENYRKEMEIFTTNGWEEGIVYSKIDTYNTDKGYWDSVRPIQPELTPEEIVEKLGKDYLLKLIKEK